MTDIKTPGLIWAKGALFLALALVASVLLVLEVPSLKAALLLVVSIWAWCRAYYFAFYVVPNYVDPGYRFSGLGSFFRYLLRKRGGRP
jgi:hypothetical protein